MRNRLIVVALALVVLMSLSVRESFAKPKGPSLAPDQIEVVSKEADLNRDGQKEYVRILAQPTKAKTLKALLVVYEYDKTSKSWKVAGASDLGIYPESMKPDLKSKLRLGIMKDLQGDGSEEILTAARSTDGKSVLKVCVWSYDKKGKGTPLRLLWNGDFEGGKIAMKRDGFKIATMNFNLSDPKSQLKVETQMYRWDGKGFSPSK